MFMQRLFYVDLQNAQQLEINVLLTQFTKQLHSLIAVSQIVCSQESIQIFRSLLLLLTENDNCDKLN